MKRRKVISAGSLISLSIIAGCSQLNRRTEEENSIIEQHLTKGSSLSISGVSITANDFLIKDEITTEGGHNTHTPTENKLYFLTLLKFENNSESEFELPSASEFVMEYNNEEMPLAELSGVIETEGGRNREVLEQKTIIPNQSHSAWIVHTLPRNYRLNQIEISFLFEREDRTIRVLWSPRERDIESRREGGGQLIVYDSITDLLPDVENFPEGNWEIDYIDETPDSDLHFDVEARYESESEEDTKIAIISVAGYDNLEDAKERYNSSFSRAESQNKIEKSLDESPDEGYVLESDEFNIRVWRDMNIVFKLSTKRESQYDLPDLSDDIRVIVQDNWQKQFM